LENLKKEFQKNAVFVVSVSEGQWNCKDKIRSGGCTVYYSRGGRAERGIVIVMHTSIVRNVFKKSVCNDRIIAPKLKEEPVNIWGLGWRSG
jgi:hypothetical protein